MNKKTSRTTTIESRQLQNLNNHDAHKLAAIFKALGVPGRVRILQMIANAGELCVQDITEVIGLSQSSVSHHLKVLSNAGVLGRTQRGTWAYYRITENFAEDLINYILQMHQDSLSQNGRTSKK